MCVFIFDFINKQMNEGFIAQYVNNKDYMKVVMVNSVEFVTVGLHVSSISIIRNLN